MQAAAAALPGDGFTVAADISVPGTTTPDMTVQLQQLKQAGATAVYAYLLNPALYVTMMQDVARMGWTNVKLFGSEAALEPSVMENIPAAVRSQFLVLGPSGLGRAGSQPGALIKAFALALFQAGGSINNLATAADGYAVLNIVAWAIKKADSAGFDQGARRIELAPHEAGTGRDGGDVHQRGQPGVFRPRTTA